MNKNWLLLIVVLLFGFLATACVAKGNDKVHQILLDGKPISSEVEPVRINDKVYTEYSSLFMALGYQPEYDSNTKTIKAISPNRTFEISEDGKNAFVDGNPVYTNEDVKKIDGQIMIAVDFVINNSGKKMNWDAKKKTVMITGPTPEQEAVFLSFLKKYSAIEAVNDTEAYRNLFTTDTEINMNELILQWEKVQTKTYFLGTFIDWYSDQEVILLVKNHVIKLSGSFYPENYSQIRYTLHPENGEWKIYDFETLEAQFVNPKSLFNQAVEVPASIKSELEAVLTAQIQALNTGDIEALAELNKFENESVKQSYLSLFPVIFDGLNNTTIEKWVIVEYTEQKQATLLISKIQDIKTEGKVRKIYSIGMEKVNGQWKFLLNTAMYLSESVD